MKEAPSIEGAFLVSTTPHREGMGVGYFKGMGMLIGPADGPNFGPQVSSSATWNLVWNFGI